MTKPKSLDYKEKNFFHLSGLLNAHGMNTLKKFAKQIDWHFFKYTFRQKRERAPLYVYSDSSPLNQLTAKIKWHTLKRLAFETQELSVHEHLEQQYATVSVV